MIPERGKCRCRCASMSFPRIQKGKLIAQTVWPGQLNEWGEFWDIQSTFFPSCSFWPIYVQPSQVQYKKKINASHMEEFFREIITSYTFGSLPGHQKVTLDRGHRGKGGLTGSTGHLHRVHCQNHRILRARGHASDIHCGDVVEGGSLNHLTQSYFVLCSLVCEGRHRCRTCHQYLWINSCDWNREVLVRSRSNACIGQVPEV